MRERFSSIPEAPSFVEIGKIADGLVDNFPVLTKSTRSGTFSYTTPFKLQELRRKTQPENGLSEGQYLEIDLELPNLPAGVARPKILVIDTPENNAITIGRIRYDEEYTHDFNFIPARFHTGYPALKDMAYAMRASLRLGPLIDNIDSSMDEKIKTWLQIFILHIAREGPLMRIEGGLFNEYRLNIPYTIVHSTHKKVKDPNNPFGRIAQVCKINFEGLVPKHNKILANADNTASGMQHVEVFRKAVNYIRKANGNSKENPHEFLVFSPLLTKYGALTVSLFAASLGINVVFITSSTILDCIPPQRYYSPVSNDKGLFVNPQHFKINELALGELTGKICSRCNWTASFTAVNAAESSSQKELAGFNWTNKMLLDRSRELTIEKMRNLKINPWSYVSYATLEEANHFGVLDKLTKELR